MSTAERIISPDEFADLAEAEQYELIDGELVEREMSNETVRIGHLIYRLLANFSYSSKLGDAHGDGISYRCFSMAPDTVRKPDVSWFKADRWSAQLIKTSHIEHAPDLIVEVLSPNEAAYDIASKVNEFFEAGTQEAWVVHPNTKQIERRFRDGRARWYGESEPLDGAPLLPGFTLKLSDVLNA